MEEWELGGCEGVGWDNQMAAGCRRESERGGGGGGMR